MSWFFGVIGDSVTQKTISLASRVHNTPLNTFFSNREFYFAAGGFQPTCLSGATSNSSNEIESVWIAAGCGLRLGQTNCTILTQNDWSGVDRDKSLLKGLSGHFVFLSYHGGQFEAYTDQLGLRTLYWARTETETIVSSRLDWAAQYLGGCTINFGSLGSRWLMFNQLSYDSLVDGIERLGPSGKLVISRDGVHHSHKVFDPIRDRDHSQDELVHLLTRFTNPDLRGKLHITLGLSGGLDSRVLFALLLSSDAQLFQTHTFGCSDDPDVYVGRKISRECGIDNSLFDATLPGPEELLRISNDYAAQTNLVEPASTILRLRLYRALDAQSLLLLDGGYGEIARRQYLNKLAFRGRRSIEEKNVEGVLKYLRHARANFFNAEVSAQMEGGIRKEIAAMLEMMPDMKEIGIANYLDLWAVRTRIPNLGSDEQARIDSILMNYMPFAQPSVITSVFNTPVRYRNNGALFRKVIAERHPALKKYPLVKNNVTYPFSMPNISAWMYTKAKRKLFYRSKNDLARSYLEAMREFILDTLNSRGVIECSAYNYRNLSDAVHSYYAGNNAFAAEVHWWFTFELWKKNIEGSLRRRSHGGRRTRFRTLNR